MKIYSSILKGAFLALILLGAGCATVLQTDQGPIQVNRKDVREKVWNVFDEEYKTYIEGQKNAKLELKNYCQVHITEEKAAFQRIEKEINLKKKYQKLSKEEKLSIGDDISKEFKSINGNDIDQASLDLMMSMHTLAGYTIEAMEEWCQKKLRNY